LTNAGFRRTAPGTWNRRSGHDLNVIQFQKQSGAETFCVNLGIHYSFLPKAGTEVAIDDDKFELPDCEVKLRLTARPSDKDQWWSISEASIDQVSSLLTSHGFSVFSAYRIDGELSAMDAKSIESGNSGLLAPVTKVRACLLLARLHEHFGDAQKCIEAASIGVKLAGMAVGPKVALKEILRRYGTSAQTPDAPQ
jgi:hypothetical protein